MKAGHILYLYLQCNKSATETVTLLKQRKWRTATHKVTTLVNKTLKKYPSLSKESTMSKFKELCLGAYQLEPDTEEAMVSSSSSAGKMTAPGQSTIKAVLIDLSGTLHVEDTAIPGAQDALERLRQSNVKIKFVTNTTKEPKRLLHEKLISLGFRIDRHEIFTSLTAAADLVKKRQLRPLLFLEKCAMEDFEGVSLENPNAVVIGLAPSCFNFDSMNAAFRLIQGGAAFIAIHKARYYKKKDGLAIGPGAFIEGLEYSTGRQAEIVGKPESRFFHGALECLGVSPENAVMIGDDAKDDVAGAKKADISTGILVQTGKYQPNDETKFQPAPDGVCQDFPAAVEYILARMKSSPS